MDLDPAYARAYTKRFRRGAHRADYSAYRIDDSMYARYYRDFPVFKELLESPIPQVRAALGRPATACERAYAFFSHKGVYIPAAVAAAGALTWDVFHNLRGIRGAYHRVASDAATRERFWMTIACGDADGTWAGGTCSCPDEHVLHLKADGSGETSCTASARDRLAQRAKIWFVPPAETVAAITNGPDNNLKIELGRWQARSEALAKSWAELRVPFPRPERDFYREIAELHAGYERDVNKVKAEFEGLSGKLH